MRSIGILSAPWTRLGLVAGFVLLVAFPLSASLREIAREVRVERATAEAEALFDQPGRSSVVARRVTIDAQRVRVLLRVATTAWYGEDDRDRFEQLASAHAGEWVDLVLEQIPAAGEDLAQLAEMMNGGAADPEVETVASAPADLGGLLHFARTRVEQALDAAVFPDSVAVIGYTMEVTASDTVRLHLMYAAAAPLSSDAATMLDRQLAQALAGQPLVTRLQHMPPPP